MMYKQLKLLDEDKDKFTQYREKYMPEANGEAIWIKHIFEKFCGANGELSPLRDNTRGQIENYQTMMFDGGDINDHLRIRWQWKHIVNLYYYITEQFEYVQYIEELQYRI